ncbi:MAG TPA: hypothetical protein VNO25_15400, partial [Streptosporangiaceae bacterium]|nr:hypothetical protein [Streptosporangiaceae bacterium]
ARQSREESRQSPLRETSLIAQIAPGRCYPPGAGWMAGASGAMEVISFQGGGASLVARRWWRVAGGASLVTRR